MDIYFPKSVETSRRSIEFLVQTYNTLKTPKYDRINLIFKDMVWFDANLLAILGSIIHTALINMNEVCFIELNSKIRDVLERNNFLGHYGGALVYDSKQTTIKFKKFKVNDDKLFRDYLANELFSRNVLPAMSEKLEKEIKVSIFEIFSNAAIHGNSDNIFTCGQFFPKKHMLCFTIVDLGVTIRDNVNKYLKINLDAPSSISWAVEEGHTTKTNSIPGGLGLSLIRDFLFLNKGNIQIVSANGYWEEISNEKGKRTNIALLEKDFDGAIVNLTFNTNDTATYSLASEREEDIKF